MYVSDPFAVHEMQLRMLGNAEVYVTCRCLERTRSNWKGRKRSDKHRSRAPSYRSLGDFPVGTPTEDLLAAYRQHLEEIKCSE